MENFKALLEQTASLYNEHKYTLSNYFATVQRAIEARRTILMAAHDAPCADVALRKMYLEEDYNSVMRKYLDNTLKHLSEYASVSVIAQEEINHHLAKMRAGEVDFRDLRKATLVIFSKIASLTEYSFKLQDWAPGFPIPGYCNQSVSIIFTKDVERALGLQCSKIVGKSVTVIPGEEIRTDPIYVGLEIGADKKIISHHENLIGLCSRMQGRLSEEGLRGHQEPDPRDIEDCEIFKEFIRRAIKIEEEVTLTPDNIFITEDLFSINNK